MTSFFHCLSLQFQSKYAQTSPCVPNLAHQIFLSMGAPYIRPYKLLSTTCAAYKCIAYKSYVSFRYPICTSINIVHNYVQWSHFRLLPVQFLTPATITTESGIDFTLSLYSFFWHFCRGLVALWRSVAYWLNWFASSECVFFWNSFKSSVSPVFRSLFDKARVFVVSIPLSV